MKIFTTLMIVLLAVIIYWLATAKKRAIKKAGNKGEDEFEHIIKSVMVNGDTLLRNIPIQYEDSRSEIDFLIINRNGIFIFEVKNYNGRLIGNEDDFSWTKIKTSPGGSQFTKEVHNPIRQVKRETYILSKELKAHGVKVWIESYAYLINGRSPVDSEHILHSASEIDRAIHKRSENDLTTDDINKIRRILK